MREQAKKKRNREKEREKIEREREREREREWTLKREPLRPQSFRWPPRTHWLLSPPICSPIARWTTLNTFIRITSLALVLLSFTTAWIMQLQIKMLRIRNSCKALKIKSALWLFMKPFSSDILQILYKAIFRTSQNFLSSCHANLYIYPIADLLISLLRTSRSRRVIRLYGIGQGKETIPEKSLVPKENEKMLLVKIEPAISALR